MGCADMWREGAAFSENCTEWSSEWSMFAYLSSNDNAIMEFFKNSKALCNRICTLRILITSSWLWDNKAFFGVQLETHFAPMARVCAILSVEEAVALWTPRHLSLEALVSGQCNHHKPCHMLVLAVARAYRPFHCSVIQLRANFRL